MDVLRRRGARGLAVGFRWAGLGLAVAWLAGALSAAALGPHEVLLLVNAGSPVSLEIGNRYAQLRALPPQNIVYVDLPEAVREPWAAIPADDFTRCVWQPAQAALAERKIDDHILAWVYSADFPVRLTTDPSVSLAGITLVRNQLPPADAIRKGTYVSPFYAGPDQPGGPAAPSRSAEQFTGGRTADLAQPSMMLGYAGARGLTGEEILRNLVTGVQADGSAPRGLVYWWLNTDVRSTCRDWQYEDARRELEQLGVRTEASSNLPSAGDELIGFMTGAAVLRPTALGRFRPGAIADNLTSYGAEFFHGDQTKLTEWLRAGAAAAAGTVTEPFALWTKFPHARLFAHYAAGCTLLESYYQALRCPLQIMLVGDPLVSPWRPPLSMVVVRTDERNRPDTAEFYAQLLAGRSGVKADYLFLLDGRTVFQSPAPRLTLDLHDLADGYHELRAVAYLTGPVRQQAFAVRGFTVQRQGRSVTLRGVEDRAQVDGFHPLALRVEAAGEPERVGVVAGERMLAEAPSKVGADLAVDLRRAGFGPVRLQAWARYADGMQVRGTPVLVFAERLNQPPVLSALAMRTNRYNELEFIPVATDAEQDPVRLDWFQAVRGLVAAESLGPWRETAAGFECDGSTCAVTVARLDLPTKTAAQELRARITITGDPAALRDQKAALVFNYQGPGEFYYFGLMGDSSSWVLGRYHQGARKDLVSRGAPLPPGASYELAIRRNAARGVECLVNGEPLIQALDVAWSGGAMALMGGGAAAAAFTAVQVSPPLVPTGTFRANRGVLTVIRRSPAEAVLVVRAADGYGAAEREFQLSR